MQFLVVPTPLTEFRQIRAFGEYQRALRHAQTLVAGSVSVAEILAVEADTAWLALAALDRGEVTSMETVVPRLAPVNHRVM